MSFTGLMKTPVQFTGLDGNDYTIGQYGFREIGLFIQWWKFKPYQDLKKAAGDNPVKEIRDKIIKTFEECQAKPLSLESDEIIKAMISPEGIHKILHLSLLIHQPTIKEEEVSNIVGPQNYEEVIVLLESAGGIKLDMGETKGQSIKRILMNLLTGHLFSNIWSSTKIHNQVKSQT